MDQNSTGADVIRSLSRPLFEARGWLRFIGVLLIIYGVLSAFSIIGLVLAWIPVWMGVLLFQTASALSNAQDAADGKEFERAQRKLKTYFIVNGVMLLILLVLSIGAIFLGGSDIFLEMSEMEGMIQGQ